MVPLGAFNHFVNSFPHQVWIGSELNRSHTDIHVWCAKRFGMIARYAPRRDGAWYFCSRGYAFKDPRAAVEFKMRWG